MFVGFASVFRQIFGLKTYETVFRLKSDALSLLTSPFTPDTAGFDLSRRFRVEWGKGAHLVAIVL